MLIVDDLNAGPVIVDALLRGAADLFLHLSLAGGQNLVHASLATSGQAPPRPPHRPAFHPVNLEQVISGNGDRILHDGAHINDVLIAREELRCQRLRAASNAIRRVAADHQALCLTHLQLACRSIGHGRAM